MSKEVGLLVFDDEESILNSLKRIFMNEPIGIVTTTDPQQALSIIEKEDIKVVFSDYRMPKISGTEFLKKVKELKPDVIRILFTGFDDFSAAAEAINIGEVYRFVSKPWNIEELKSTVEHAIEHYDLVMHNRDLILETKQKNEELEEVNQKLQKAYDAQKYFTSTVSHELRTPLASIKTAIDLLVSNTIGGITDDQKDVLSRVQRNVNRLKMLDDDILDLTKIELGKLVMVFEKHDLHVTINDVIDSQRDLAEDRGLYLKVNFDERVPQVNFDINRIIQVLNNLISNAVKFTSEGGITVVTRNCPDKNHISVSIKDTGKGISKEDESKLSKKFQQLESAVENTEGGTGLSLAICKEIILRHGGKIWVESELGKGSSFIFILPLQERRGEMK
ncbi:MAG: signal transduction histidine kinase [Lysobacterales bacterium]|jgi:signal transduction histidine kinase